jgi:hypothetical protein
VAANLALAGTVVQVGVLDGLSAAHFVDADVPIGDGAVRKGEVQPHRTAEQKGAAADDEAVCFALGIVRGIHLVADLICQ